MLSNWRTFVFQRGHRTRGNAHVLFATLALQLALETPELGLPISRMVEKTPTLVAGSMEAQLRELIIEPCRTLELNRTRTILIGGLDECDAQGSLRLRFIIASRPELYTSVRSWKTHPYCTHKSSLRLPKTLILSQFSVSSIHRPLWDMVLRH
jgi:hypothetical protein